MKNDIDSNFAIAILALVAACLGFSFWFLYTSDDQDANPANTITQNTSDQRLISTDELLNSSLTVTENWNTFTDESGIFSLRYPEAYESKKYESPNVIDGYVELTGADECHPITLTKYANPQSIKQVGDLLTFEGQSDEIFFTEYHQSYNYRSVVERDINSQPFLFSESMPYIIAAATVTDDWIIEIVTTDEYGGAYIENACRELFLKTLSTFTLSK